MLLCLCWERKIHFCSSQVQGLRAFLFWHSLSTTLRGRSVLIFREESSVSFPHFHLLSQYPSGRLCSLRRWKEDAAWKASHGSPVELINENKRGEGCVRERKKARDTEIRRQSVKEQMWEKEGGCFGRLCFYVIRYCPVTVFHLRKCENGRYNFSEKP